LFVFKAWQQAHSRLRNCCHNTEDGQKDKLVVDIISCTFLSLVLALSVNQPTLAHSGPHHSKACIIEKDSMRFRFSGYQFHSRHPEQHYCRYFPLLGDVIISIDSLQEINNINISLQWLEMSAISEFSFSLDTLFKVSHETPWKAFNNGVNSIKQSVQKRGIYALNIQLKNQNNEIKQKRFYFLVGFQIAKILLVIGCLLLLIIAVIFFKQNKPMKTG
jgi:hypothetical protein